MIEQNRLELLEVARNMLPRGHQLLYLTYSGSTLHGTDDEYSDRDLYGVYVPSMSDILLNDYRTSYKYPPEKDEQDKRANTSADVDIKLWSLDYLFKLLVKNDINAIDLIFSLYRTDTILTGEPVFIDLIKSNIDKFVSKELGAFTGYAFSQAERYGLRGSRYSEVKYIVDRYDDWIVGENKLFSEYSTSEFFDYLEENDLIGDKKYIKIETKQLKSDKSQRFLWVLDKQYHDKLPLKLFDEQLHKRLSKFGDRVKGNLDGMDYKALSHAVRAIYEIEELAETGKITFPLRNADILREIKRGDMEVKKIFKIINVGLPLVTGKMRESGKIRDSIDKIAINRILLDYYYGILEEII